MSFAIPVTRRPADHPPGRVPLSLVTEGYCWQCNRPTSVVRVRLFGLGLRWCCERCAGWYADMGAHIEVVPEQGTRGEDRGIAFREERGIHVLRRRWADR